MNDSIKRFNLRVYGIWVRDFQVLLVEEDFQGYHLTKFPGGGVHLGEGILDALKREWKEEVGNELKTWKHFYTTEFFQRSFFNPEDQIISVYYLVEPATLHCAFAPGLSPKWIPLAQLKSDHFTLPIDQYVAHKLIREPFLY